MTNTVTKLMARVHAIENLASLAADPMNSESEQTEYVNDLVATRQALQDELTRLFTPLTDEQKDAVWMRDENFPQDSFEAGVEWAEKQHGITGESK